MKQKFLIILKFLLCICLMFIGLSSSMITEGIKSYLFYPSLLLFLIPLCLSVKYFVNFINSDIQDKAQAQLKTQPKNKKINNIKTKTKNNVNTLDSNPNHNNVDVKK